MERILIDYARARNAKKRGHGLHRVTLTDGAAVTGILKDDGATSLRLISPGGAEQVFLRKDVTGVRRFASSLMPSFAAYCATKHYVTGLSEALVADLAGTGVVVTQVLPGPVATEFEQQIGNFTGVQAPGIVEISATRCARSTIRGFDRRRAMVVPGILISLVLLVNALSPRFMRRLFASILGRIARRKEAEAAA